MKISQMKSIKLKFKKHHKNSFELRWRSSAKISLLELNPRLVIRKKQYNDVTDLVTIFTFIKTNWKNRNFTKYTDWIATLTLVIHFAIYLLMLLVISFKDLYQVHSPICHCCNAPAYSLYMYMGFEIKHWL